ncbi:MAG: phosphinothricin acetyltransferase [Alteromonadaceae bacterium]|nr:MAG: phosphinothricin acetyltransferase [Alteromonadaceae bacterium]
MNIRKCTTNDSKYICSIYNYYIKNTIITFEEDLVTESIISKRVETCVSGYPWLVVENEENVVVGYAYATKWAERSAYRKTVEITVYIDNKENGRGYGSALYKELLFVLSNAGFHTAIAGISLPNDASIKIHEAFGFSKVGHFVEAGLKFGKWVDVGYWQKRL